jgi:hypothetical protein
MLCTNSSITTGFSRLKTRNQQTSDLFEDILERISPEVVSNKVTPLRDRVVRESHACQEQAKDSGTASENRWKFQNCFQNSESG